EAYRCWKEVWSEALLELDGSDKIHSDEFTRHDEVSAVFLKNKCIGTTSFCWMDFGLSPTKDDSYFKIWTPKAIEALTKYDSKVLVCSFFTLHPDGRQGKLGINMKDVLMGLLVKRFLDSGAKSMTGTVRNNRGVNLSTYRHGAEVLERDLKLHGVDVDLVAFYQDTAHVSQDPIIAHVVESLWNKRLTYADKATRLQARLPRAA
ncbi:MAG TPA: hypothetical protein VFV50_10145, partial [Bdellovibrionales bacterium]|nr:hypothetical protein [Bdellovibrionales bacterium]